MSFQLQQLVPAFGWLRAYRRDDLSGDLIAGGITAMLLIPQAMAYSLLAGLPPQVGLYASILPPILYALFGSSRVLAVGPVAVASIMVATVLASVAVPGSSAYYGAALVLALLIGLMLFLMGVFRLGFIANFLGHPVMSGFTSGAAILIAFSQFKHLLGLPMPSDLSIFEKIGYIFEHSTDISQASVVFSAVSLMVFFALRSFLPQLLARFGVSENVVSMASKSSPLILVALATTAVALMQLDQNFGINIVGAIPAGLPGWTLPEFDKELWVELIPAAMLIALVSFVESVSIAKVLASRRRQAINVNQELVGLGIANIGSAFTGGSPVCGGFSRSAVNFSAGANTQMAGIITAGIIALAVGWFTPLFYYLPQAVLAVIIIVSILGLVNLRLISTMWRYNQADGLSLVTTMITTLVLGVELGIIAGVVLSLVLYLWRTSRPHIAVVGRVGNTEHFRNVERHSVHTTEKVMAVRVDESLYFANAGSLENYLLSAVAKRPEIEHLLLIFSAVNFIDSSALETLERLIEELSDSGVQLHLSEIKGPVEDKLRTTDFLERLQPGSIYLSTHEAMVALEGLYQKEM
jgi:SulP family sulfate permease